MRAAVRTSINFLLSRAASFVQDRVMEKTQVLTSLYKVASDVKTLQIHRHRTNKNTYNNQAPLVLMFVDSFYDGGVERVVIDLCIQLRNSGRDCKILVAKNGGRSAQEARLHGIEVVEFGQNHHALKQFIATNKNATAIIHHCYFSLDLFHNAGIPIIEVIHNAYYWQNGNFQIKNNRDQLISKFIAVSEFVRDYSVNELAIDWRKIDRINNGLSNIDLVRPPLDLLRLGRLRTCSEPILLHVANLHPQKNHRLVVNAFSYVKRAYPKARLIMAGAMDGHPELLASLLADIENLEVSNSVELTGALDRRKLSRAMASAHIGLLPSILEGFSIATLEFTFFGLPSVLSATGAAGELESTYGHVEIAEGCALPQNQLSIGTFESTLGSFPDQIVLKLSDAILRILKNYPQYLDKALIAGDRFSDYSIEHTANQFIQLLESIENEKKSNDAAK